MRKALSAKAALLRLEELCSRSEQCSWDLRQRLFRWGVDPESHDEVIDSLMERRFVDDRRFAAAYVRDKYRFDRWGRLKIVRGLMAKRMPRSVIDSALEEIDVKEYARNCYQVMKSKLKGLPDDADAFTLRQRLLRFSAGRGYEPSLIIRLLDNPKLWGGRLS